MVITLALGMLVLGSLVFSFLSILAAFLFLSSGPKTPVSKTKPIPISVLKPLAGLDEGLESNLRSFFSQDYPDYEILMAVATPDDPALPLARKLASAYPHIPSQILIAGEPPYPNRKVRSIHVMTEAATHELLVMSDSDIRVDAGFLWAIAAEFADPALTLTTCLYRAVPGDSPWSRLEAVMMNTEFLAGILTARMLEGMRFAVGPTIACRKQAVAAIGGFESLKDFLAEDFVFGQRVAAAGLGVGLSHAVIEHRIGTSNWKANAEHRLRWVRSTRRSRPAGYIGQLFTYPVPLALLLAAWNPSFWPVLPVTLALRLFSAWQTALRILGDPIVRRQPWLVPVQDILSFLFWIAGFIGNTIDWRGKVFYLNPDGTFRRVR